MVKIKHGVSLRGLRPEMAVVISVANDVFLSFGKDAIITSGTDSKHGHGSLHYVGAALDFRTKHLEPGDGHLVASQLREALGSEFDVLYESEGEPNEHIHVEFQPKGAL